MYDFFRGRRLRRSQGLRDMVAEVRLSPANLMQPYFVVEDDPKAKRPISSMPGQFQFGLDALYAHLDVQAAAGLRSLILFGLPSAKDPEGGEAYNDDGIVQKAIRGVKTRFPELMVATDVCLCEYTSHGHCGLLTSEGTVDNDATLPLLAATALSHARAGADLVAPSDMMDGRVAAIRDLLDENGFADLPVMSYAVKYASALYGPFREAADSTPAFGDRKGYQMDFRRAKDAWREAEADVAEGADILMVKPATLYLDILAGLRDRFDLPLAAYQVSGEYAQIMAASRLGWIDEARVAMESLTAIRRAGADLILTYFTEAALGWLREQG